MVQANIAKTFISGALIDAHQLFFIEYADALKNTDFISSVISRYEHKSKIENPWWGRIYEDWTIVSLCYDQGHDLRCVLDREGQIRLYGPGGKPDHSYQIAQAGVFGDAAIGLGYVNRIRAIAGQLYVCGQSRQVYRFAWNGQDLATGQWINVAGPMRQAPLTEPPATDAGEDAFDAWLDSDDHIDFVDIDGSAADDMYAVGDEVWHCNGRSWQRLTLPTDEPINAIKVIDAQRVWMVGHNGTLLYGNANTGFKDLSGVDDNQNFIGLEVFNNTLFLASNLGLYIYDNKAQKIEPYRTTLQPDLQDSHVLEAKEGVLWSIGFKDIARFDGKQWQRIDHPDNPPIR